MSALSEAELLGEDRTPIARPAGAGGSPYDLVLLDRDGTLNVHRPGYVADPDDLVLLPGAADAVRECNAAGAVVVLITNQRGLAIGELTRAQLLAVHRRLVAELAACGAHLDGVQVCPHAEATCGCRKPRTGLLREAFRRAPWADPARCVLIGDQASDVAAAEAAGVAPVRLNAPESALDAVVRRLFAERPSRCDTTRTDDATVR